MAKCRRGHELEVIVTNGNIYIGTFDPEDGYQYCRCTGYYRDKITAEHELAELTFEERHCGENRFCNGYTSCVIK